ncbi:MAG TPA: alpha/beta hydrolase [Streptosporangiaceae bacterium]|nr:alpha/beta hydrolase [Streptosporangiaceae bacterium]
MAFADLGDVRLFYTDDDPSGTATPLLLVHGWGADGHEWSWHIPQLSADRRVIAPDLRGHGYSSAPASGFHPRDMTEDLLRLLDRLGIDEVIAIGHSMGAQIVSILAVEHPARVRALVCVEPGYGFDGAVAAGLPEMARRLEEGDTGAVAVWMDEWSYTPASPPMLRHWHARRLLAMRPHVLAESFAAMFTGPDQIGVRPATDAYLARRACPVLSLWSDPDRGAWEQELFKDPASAAIAWPGSGHRPHEERPAEFLLVVARWLAKLEAQDRRRGHQQ